MTVKDNEMPMPAWATNPSSMLITEADFNDKRAEYAAQGIPVYLIVVMSGSEIDSIAEYRLDWSGRNYQLVTVHRRSLTTEVPEGMKLDVPFRQLEQV